MVEKENRIEDKGKKTKKRIVPLHAHLITFSKKKTCFWFSYFRVGRYIWTGAFLMAQEQYRKMMVGI